MLVSCSMMTHILYFGKFCLFCEIDELLVNFCFYFCNVWEVIVISKNVNSYHFQ